MPRRRTVTAAALLIAALGAAPASAGSAKTIKGSYKVTLTPDPTAEATGLVSDGCSAINPAAIDNHAFTVPGAGTLAVVLDAPDPAGSPATDWDLYLVDPDGTVNSGSAGMSSHEEATAKFKKGQKLTIQVCNLAGAPNGTVSYVFTPKK